MTRTPPPRYASTFLPSSAVAILRRVTTAPPRRTPRCHSDARMSNLLRSEVIGDRCLLAVGV
eukprot:scaffold209858_cov31-Tisochrysis_lutea.AAC.1